jgi:hypothetical protein
MAGWNKLTFTLVEIRVRLDRSGAPKVDRAVLEFVKSRVFDPGELYRSARWHCMDEFEIGAVRAKDLSLPSRKIRLGDLGRAPIWALHYDTFSSPVVTDGVARNRDSRLSPARRRSSALFIVGKFVRGDATARL